MFCRLMQNSLSVLELALELAWLRDLDAGTLIASVMLLYIGISVNFVR